MVRKVRDRPSKRSEARGKTVEARENQLISLAVDLAEEQLRNGTASALVLNHYLKLGSTREGLEKDRLKQENDLLRAKTEALQSSKRIEELYTKALDMIRVYSGSESDND